MFNSQLNTLKSGIKNGIEVTLNLSSNFTRNFNYENNIPCKLLLTDYYRVSKKRKTFANCSSDNIKFPKTKLSKIRQAGEIIADLLAAILHGIFLAKVETLKR